MITGHQAQTGKHCPIYRGTSRNGKVKKKPTYQGRQELSQLATKTIDSHHGLVYAIKAISSGQRNASYYRPTSDLDGLSLRYAESLRNRGLSPDSHLLVRMGVRELASGFAGGKLR